ncbi:ARM repeat-containing protein [Sistotremastrum suecicum HHB10207 ss-3]|uniref:ARM repeat-containing protein n=1 Tax=Sistotremastrum suecicum HHB10207 ss-3 TaxID=1314776 RepID=A0A166IRZ2_9AGAM|nr:ARM repeat-containing protein [Sistotremastrum suecicum HHB10207 ss-3]
MSEDTLLNLKSIKNKIGGKQSAKTALAHQGIIPAIVHNLNLTVDPSDSVASPAQFEILTETSHIISSLSHGSRVALNSLQAVNVHRPLLHQVSSFRSGYPLECKSAILRAFKSLTIAYADVVGPPLWGLDDEWAEARDEATNALKDIFELKNLDFIMPILLDPNHQLSLHIIQVLGSALRDSESRKQVSQWLPPSERASNTKAKRGWEKVGPSKTPSVAQNSSWVVRQLTNLISSRDVKMQEASLYAIAALSKENKPISTALAQSNAQSADSPPIENIARLFSARAIDVQISACLCAVYILRASHSTTALRHTSSSLGPNMFYTIMHILNRIISSTEPPAVKTKACYILAALATDELELQKDAWIAGCLRNLFDLLESIACPIGQNWTEEEPLPISRMREAAFMASAQLCMLNDEPRREALEYPIIPLAYSALSHPHVAVRYAACQLIRAMTRSVQFLRTSVADTGIGAKLLSIIQDSTEDLRVRNIAIEGVCNLLYSFSPYRTVLIDKEVIKVLVSVLDINETSIQVNSLWAIRNLLWDSSYTEKADVMSSLGWGRLSGYFTNPNELIKEKAMAILDNLAWREPDLQFIFDRLGEETLCVALENAVSSSNADLVEQGLKTFTTMCSSDIEHRIILLTRSKLLRGLKECLQHPNVEVRREAGRCVLQLVKAIPRRHQELREHGIDHTLRLMHGGHGVKMDMHGPSTSHQMGYEEDPQVRGDVKEALGALFFVRE